jgi:O-antigen/teichoic acid export membrane protein
MFKRFLKDSAIYGISTFFARSVVFILLPLYTRLLTASEFGVIELLTVFGNFVNVTIALEISQALVRFFPEVANEKDKKSYASTALWFTLFAYTIFLVLANVYSGWISLVLLSDDSQNQIFVMSLFATWFYGIFYLVQTQLRVELMAMQYAISNLAMNLSSVGSTLILILGFGWDAMGVIAGQLIGNIVGFSVSLYYSRHIYAFSFDWSKLWEMLVFSLPLVISSIGSSALLYANRFVLGGMMSLSEVGLLGVAYRVIAPVNLLVLSIQNAAMPIIFSDYRKPDAPKELTRLFLFFVAMALFAFLSMSLFSKELFKIMASSEYQGAASTTPYLVASALMGGMTLFAPGLYIKKATTIVASVTLLSGSLTIVFSYWLISILGVKGAAIASLVGSTFAFILFMFFSQKYYYVQHDFKKAAIAVFASIAILAVGSLLKDVNIINFLVKLFVLALFVFFLVFLGLIEKNKINLLIDYVIDKMQLLRMRK